MLHEALPPLASYKRKLQNLFNDIDTLEKQLHPEPSRKRIPRPVVDNKIKMFKTTQERSRSVTPTFNRFPKPMREKVGPGYYQSKSPTQEISYEFGNAPRFAENLSDKISNYHAKVLGPTDKEREIIRLRINSNRNLSLFRPEARLESIKQRAKLLAVREQLTKETKEAISIHEKSFRLMKLRIKENKLEMRLRKAEVNEVGKSWITLSVIIGSAYVGYRMALNRKQLHIRSDKTVKFFLILSITVGKILVILRRYRSIKTNKKLQPFRRYVKNWVDRRNRKFTQLVLDTVEGSLTRNLFMRIMFDWRSKVMRMQRAMLYCLLCKKVLYIRLCKKWSEACPTRIHAVPDPIKVIYLRDAIKGLVKSFNKDIEIWKDICKAVSESEIITSKPPRPKLKLAFSKEDFTKLDSYAKLHSNRWHYMLHKDRHIRRVNH